MTQQITETFSKPNLALFKGGAAQFRYSHVEHQAYLIQPLLQLGRTFQSINHTFLTICLKNSFSTYKKADNRYEEESRDHMRAHIHVVTETKFVQILGFDIPVMLKK
jgi:hypothetical protein